jgi:hypothetical protein
LLANEVEIGDPIILDEENDWSYTFTELLGHTEEGVAIFYTAIEIEVPKEYTVSYTRDGSHITITNSHTPVDALTVVKEWDDVNNSAGIRPLSIEVQLLADGEELGEPEVLNLENGWAYTFTELPRYTDEGEVIDYDVIEINVPEGYTVSYERDGYLITIINTHIPQMYLGVVKVWDDNNNSEGLRTNSISVQLQADGINQGPPVTLNPANNWSYTFTDLLVYTQEERPVVYTVIELNVPVGYTESYSPIIDGTITITNTLIPSEYQPDDCDCEPECDCEEQPTGGRGPGGNAPKTGDEIFLENIIFMLISGITAFAMIGLLWGEVKKRRMKF